MIDWRLFLDVAAADVTAKESEPIDLFGIKIVLPLQFKRVQKLVVGSLIERVSELVRGTPDERVHVVYLIVVLDLVRVEVVDVWVGRRHRFGSA